MPSFLIAFLIAFLLLFLRFSSVMPVLKFDESTATSIDFMMECGIVGFVSFAASWLHSQLFFLPDEFD